VTASRVAAWIIALVAAVLVAAQLVLIATSWSHPGAEAFFPRFATLLDLASYAAWALAGVVIAMRRPDNPIGWLVCAVGIGLLLLGLQGEYAVRGLLVAPGSLPIAEEVAVLGNTVWVLPFGLIPIVLLLYPTGRFVSPAWVLAALPTMIAIVLILGIGTGLAWQNRDQALELMMEISNSTSAENQAAFNQVAIVGVLLIGLSLAAAVASIVIRFRRARGPERLQIKWLLLASIAIFSQVIIVIAKLLLNADFGEWEGLFGTAAGAAVPIAIGIAILRHRLYDIDLIIRRTLVYGALTVVLGGAYVGSVLGLQAAMSPFTSNNGVAVALSTLAVAALFGPVRRRVQRLVDQRFYRSRYDAQRTLAMFSARLRDEVDPASLSSELLGATRATVQPSSASIWLRERAP